MSSAADSLKKEIQSTAEWCSGPRFKGVVRLHTARQIVEQRGTIAVDYSVARTAAEAFHPRLRALFKAHKSITTFGPYSPGQAVMMKRRGIEGIYLGGWATSAKGSINEDPGADLASYPLNQVPDEAASIVRALLTADRNQHFARMRATAAHASTQPEVDYRPFIIADADTGHGGDAHVRNLIRRFVEVGVPGYHIEDQKPGAKKCGHQGGKVLVAQNEQAQRLNAARLQLDVMRVPGLIVARTDAEAATLLESNTDERDEPFILGATADVPSYKTVVVATHRTLFELGVTDIRGHLMFEMSDAEYTRVQEWLTSTGAMSVIRAQVDAHAKNADLSIDDMLDAVLGKVLDRWQADANLRTYRQTVADAIAARLNEGAKVGTTVAEWLQFARHASLGTAMKKAAALGIQVVWDCESARTPEGYYQVLGGLEYAIARSLSAAPFADLLWMETNTANLREAKAYADAIHKVYPDKMLAYNLSPSFNWDTTGMSDEEMEQFPAELGKLGFVFNFITYGGHQIDGLAAEEFALSLKNEGMLALAKLQRKLRLLDSPYRTPQTLVGGPRLDAALMAASGRTATTRAMGQGSTQHQHLKETELSPKVLEAWLAQAALHHKDLAGLRARLRPAMGGSDLLELTLLGEEDRVAASIVFAPLQDRLGRSTLAMREANVSDRSASGTCRLILAHLFLIGRYESTLVQYLSPTDQESEFMRVLYQLGVFTNVTVVPAQLALGEISEDRVRELSASENLTDTINAQLAAVSA